MLRLEELGGARFHPRTDLNKEDWGAVDTWILGALVGLQQLELATVGELGGGANQHASCSLSMHCCHMRGSCHDVGKHAGRVAEQPPGFG